MDLPANADGCSKPNHVELPQHRSSAVNKYLCADLFDQQRLRILKAQVLSRHRFAMLAAFGFSDASRSICCGATRPCALLLSMMRRAKIPALTKRESILVTIAAVQAIWILCMLFYYGFFSRTKRDVISLARHTFGYETPFIDLQASTFAAKFRQIPQGMVDFNCRGQAELLDSLAEYLPEYTHVENNMFVECDGRMLHAFLRKFQPKRLFEIGSGFSTRIANHALLQNEQQFGVTARHVCIEPYRGAVLQKLGLQRIEVIPSTLQMVDFQLFDELEAGDMLFIDSSHVVAPYGDVIALYIHILPRLKTGVIVHIHDIFLPFDYPENWQFGQYRGYTEQELLAAFLYGNKQWEVLFAVSGSGIFDSDGDSSCSSLLSVESFRRICHQPMGSHPGGSIYIRKTS